MQHTKNLEGLVACPSVKNIPCEIESEGIFRVGLNAIMEINFCFINQCIDIGSIRLLIVGLRQNKRIRHRIIVPVK